MRPSADEAHLEAHAGAVREVGGAGRAAVELGNQAHDVQAQAEVRPVVLPGARLRSPARRAAEQCLSGALVALGNRDGAAVA